MYSPLKQRCLFFTCLTCLFFMSFSHALHQPHSQWNFSFSHEKDEQILGLRLTMKNNVRYVVVLTCIECLTKLQRSYQEMVVFFFFSLSQLGTFSIDQMEFICWAQRIRTMSLQRSYNISDVGTALRQAYYSQLWQVDCHFFIIFFRRF